VLLFVPGLVTDLAGLLLVLPPIRGLVRRRLVRAAEERSPDLRSARIRSQAPVVDGEVVEPQPPPNRHEPEVIEGTIVPRDPR
jgi:UPF0716 protein FxsA